MPYYGHQQNVGGFAYYFSGFKERNRNFKRPKEEDLNKPDAKVTETPDMNNPNEKVKHDPTKKSVEMEVVEIKKKDKKDYQVVGAKMEYNEENYGAL